MNAWRQRFVAFDEQVMKTRDPEVKMLNATRQKWPVIPALGRQRSSAL